MNKKLHSLDYYIVLLQTYKLSNHRNSVSNRYMASTVSPKPINYYGMALGRKLVLMLSRQLLLSNYLSGEQKITFSRLLHCAVANFLRLLFCRRFWYCVKSSGNLISNGDGMFYTRRLYEKQRFNVWVAFNVCFQLSFFKQKMNLQ